MNNPFIEIHDRLLELSKELGYDTYDYLPEDDVPYPFVFIGEMFTLDRPTKDRTLADASIIIHVWNFKEDSRKTKEMCFELSKAFIERSRTAHFNWQVVDRQGNFIFEKDELSNSTLSHGILEFTFKTT